MSRENTRLVHALSVRAVVEFALERGDLAFDMQMIDRMQDGLKGHKQVQGDYPKDYQAEVPVRLDMNIEGVDLSVSGRIDGLLLRDGECPLIDEIKTTRRDISMINEDDYPVHWAQAECYAYMICEQYDLPMARVRLTYYQMSGEQVRFERSFLREPLRARFVSYATPYALWAKQLDGYLSERNKSIRELSFPFDAFRKGQRDFSANTYIALREGKNLLAQAPTGTGKTLAVLFPAIKALGEGLAARAFYLTARTTTRALAESAIEKMREGGLHLRSVTLTAKDKMCLHPMEKCSPETCDRARGYYDRRRDALKEGLTLQTLKRADIEALAERHCLCPFELSLDLCEIADVIICDYNHAFDPRVKLKRFFMDGGDYALLIDEAHNLIDRAQSMLSATLSQRAFEDLRRETGKVLGRKSAIYRRLTTLIAAFKAIRAESDAPRMEDLPPESLIKPLQKFSEAASALFLEPHGLGQILVDGFFSALSYLRAAEGYDEHDKTLIEPDGKRVAVKIWCYDVAPYLKDCYKHIRAAVLFSATLAPMTYYFNALGLSEDNGDAMLDLPSPFPIENQLTLRLSLSTKYQNREASAPDVAKAILAMCRAKRGNYLACFPSYAYLRQVKALLEADEGIRLLVQQTAMDDDQRADFLAQFEPDPERSMLALIAMGGIFSEGIDLPGEKLSGAAIVGVGIPQISFERDRMKALLDADGEGYRRAYTYPGIERVLQAAGRVIRTEQDRGVVLLIDERFSQAQYRALLPRHYRVRDVRDVGMLENALIDFWKP